MGNTKTNSAGTNLNQQSNGDSDQCEYAIEQKVTL